MNDKIYLYYKKNYAENLISLDLGKLMQDLRDFVPLMAIEKIFCSN